MDDAKFESQKKRELSAAISESRSEAGEDIPLPGLELINEVFLNDPTGRHWHLIKTRDDLLKTYKLS